jgi:PqqD family protein of HPr-rel-A system
MSIDARLKELAISENGFVFDPHSGGTFSLNGTGQAIVKGLRDGTSAEEIVPLLRANFDEVASNVAEDVQDFLRTLRDFGLLSR